ncbi:MAG: DEAD/DEAH box helicase, partial [Alphaproteobacteria bacterium]
MENFNALGLRPELLSTLAQMNFTIPTPIQAAAIPPALEGRDVLGTAQTGTGKTGAFGIPLIMRLLNNPRDLALVMTPTRELAVQVMAMLEQLLGKNSGINSALLIGGESMQKQLRQLHARPRLIVGTPGRINDHRERGSVKLHNARFLVLDETDRMLDMGFGVQIDRILAHLPKIRQSLLFSATLPPDILKI